MLILVRFPKRRLAMCSVFCWRLFYVLCEIYVQRLTVFSEVASEVKKKCFSIFGNGLTKMNSMNRDLVATNRTHFTLTRNVPECSNS
jgi:hypothetical protein